MSELKKEKLLNILETAFSHLLKDINYKETRARYEQAKKQVKVLIREDNIKRDMIIDNRLRIQKPEVTEKWIEEKVNEMERMFLNDGIRIDKRADRADFIRSLVEESASKDWDNARDKY